MREEIKYPKDYDNLQEVELDSVYIIEYLNILKDSILNLEKTLGLDINVGNAIYKNLSDRLKTIELMLSNNSLIFKELNVSNTLIIQESDGHIIKIGSNNSRTYSFGKITHSSNQPIDILSDVNLDGSIIIKDKSSYNKSVLKIVDKNNKDTLEYNDYYSLYVDGNCYISGRLVANIQIEHDKLNGLKSFPKDNQERVIPMHVTQGDYHNHKKGYYDKIEKKWYVNNNNIDATGIISHNDLIGIGTKPEHGDDFIPVDGIAYHVTYGDNHRHSKEGDGAPIDHNDLYNTDPKISNHVTYGDFHRHSADGDGARISHNDLIDVQTIGGAIPLHVTYGDAHRHSSIGDGGRISHKDLLDIGTKDLNDIHVTKGDNHAHSLDQDGNPVGDGAQIDHNHLKNIGIYTHDKIDEKIEELNNLIRDFNNHNHSPGSGGKPITPSSIIINSDLSFGGYSVINAYSYNFTDLSTLLSGDEYKNRLFVYGGDLYYIGSNGRPVKIAVGSGSITSGEWIIGSGQIYPSQINIIYSLPQNAVAFDGSVYINLNGWIGSQDGKYSEFYKIYGVRISSDSWDINSSSVGTRTNSRPIDIISDGNSIKYISDTTFNNGIFRYEYNIIEY